MAFIGNNGASKMCNFDLTTNTNRGSFGISSIGDVATGAQRFNFSANEANAHYTIVSSSVGSLIVTARSTSTVLVLCKYRTPNGRTIWF